MAPGFKIKKIPEHGRTITEADTVSENNRKILSPLIIGAINIVSGIFCMVISISLSFTFSQFAGATAGYITTAAGLLISIPLFAGGCGLVLYRRWGRLLSAAATWISLVALLVYLVFMTGTFIYIADMLDQSERSRFTIRIFTIILLCIYPVATLVLLHGKKLRDTMV